VPGGQASHTSLIENFFGFPDGIGGAELARLAGRQAERFGAELMFLNGVEGSGGRENGRTRLELKSGHEIEARTVIAAPGMIWRRLRAEGVEDLLDRGVYYGAGRSEAAQCGGDPVVVVGAGNSAGQAVMNLANAGARVTMVVRGDRLGKSMSAYLVHRIEAHPLVEVRLRTEVDGVETEDGRLSAVRVRDAGGSTALAPALALFLCLGGVPRTDWAAAGGVRLDSAGFVLTGPDLLDAGRRPEGWPLPRDPLALETTVPGLFAAGDVRHGSTKRVAGAVGDGAMAVALVHRRLAELEGA
jgi:thioredoxin reductase (NADPH)